MTIIDILYLIVYGVMFFCSTLWLIVFLINRKVLFNTPTIRKFPYVTFLIPAYNEEKNIKKCLDSLLALNYPKKKVKIIVIDDGSVDKTEEIVKSFGKKVKFLKKEHGGKASCLNYGLKHVKTEFFACMDADSLPEKNYLIKMLGFFKGGVSAVTPAMKISKSDTLIRKIQWVEYLFAIFLRKLFSIFDCQYVVPGPGSIYRTCVIKRLGGFDDNNLTEDMEIAFRLMDKGYKIENAIDAYVYTDSPKNFKDLYKQRIRWYRGYFQNVAAYKHMILNPKYGNLGFFLLPMNFVWVFMLAFLFFMPIITWVNKFYIDIMSLSAISYGVLIPDIQLSIFYIDFYAFFSLAFFFFALLAIYLSVKVSKEKVNLKNKKIFYFSYLFLYPLLLSIFWIVAALYEILRVEKKW